MQVKVRIKDLRKEPYENWNHYNFERYNDCPWCGGKLHMLGQVNDIQVFKCYNCERAFELNVETEEIEYDSNSNEPRLFKIEYEVDTGVDYIEDVAFVKSTSAALARQMLKNHIHQLSNDFMVSKFMSVCEEDPFIMTGKFGSK